MTRPTNEQAAREMEKSLDPIEREIAAQWLLGDAARKASIAIRHFATFESYRRIIYSRSLIADLEGIKP